MKAPRRAKLIWRLQSKLSRRFPSIVPHPERRSLLQGIRQSDAEANARTTLTGDEAVSLQCLWVVEFYTPAHISSLLTGFEELGWNLPDSSGAASNPTRWIQRIRHSPQGWGWLNLGTIYRDDAQARSSQSRSAPLPNEVEYAIAAMHSLTSSLACIVIGFVYDENKRNCFERELKKDRQTFFQNIPKGGYTILTPDAQKVRSVRDVRTQLRTEAFNFFRSCLPGLFASGVLLHEFPTCEFLLLHEMAESSGDENGASRIPKWHNILGIDDDHHIWDAMWLEGLSFTWPLDRVDNSQYQSAIVAREETFSDDVMKMYGGRDRNSVIYYVDHSLSALFSRWGVLGMLSGYERCLNIMRDSLVPTSAEVVKSAKILRQIRNHLVRSIDIATMASDLQEFVKTKAIYSMNMHDFKVRKTFFPEEGDISLTEILSQQTTDRMAGVHEVEKNLRDVLMQYGNTISAQQNIKLQRRMTFLTWAIVLLTIVAVGLAATSVFVSASSERLVLPW